MITIPRLFLHVMISVDTPGNRKGIKREKILFWFGVYFGLVFIACACINPGIELATLA